MTEEQRKRLRELAMASLERYGKLALTSAELELAANPAAILELLDEVERLRDALQRFGEHGTNPDGTECGIEHEDHLSPPHPCTCGFDEALK